MTRSLSKLAAESLSHLEPGSLVGGYRVERVLSLDAGNRALVQALSPEGRRVAMRLLGVATAHAKQTQRVHALVRVRSSIEHPHLVRLLGAGEHEGRLYLVSELAATRTLADRLADGALPPDEAIQLVAGVAGALEAAGREGLHHSELAPQAIFIGDERPTHALLTDFGIGRVRSRPPDLRLTVEGADYLPPEEIRGDALALQSNSYSLACILFECLSGTPPYPYERPLLTLHAHLVEAPPRLSQRCPELPPALDDLFTRALAKDPGQRFDCLALVQTAAEALGLEADIPRTVVGEPEPETAPAPVVERKAVAAPERKPVVERKVKPKRQPKAKPQRPPKPRRQPKAKPRRQPKPARPKAPVARRPAPAPAPPSRRRQPVRGSTRRPGVVLAVAVALLASAAGGFVLGNPSSGPTEPTATARAQPQADAARLAQAEYVRGLSPVIDRLSERRAAARHRLRRARRPKSQAQAARALAGAYADAHKALAGEPPESLEGARLDAQLRSAERAYRRLGAAALRDNRRAWRSASRAAIEQERRLERSLGTLASA